MEKTFVIIKPDAIRRGLVGSIISRFEQERLTIDRIGKRFKNVEWFNTHYEDVLKLLRNQLRNEAYLTGFMVFTVNAPLIGIILNGKSVIERVRKMVGATNALEAAPFTIRGDFGQHSDYRNLIHAADSKEAVEKEIKLFFDEVTNVRS